jgi:hypothetical protein
LSDINSQSRAAAIDWRGVPPPTRQLIVIPVRTQDIAAGALVVIMGGLIAMVLLGPITPARLMIAGAMALILVAVIALRVRAVRRMVRSFGAEGVTLRDGRRFGWNSFRGVVRRTRRLRSGHTVVWRLELNFDDGESAWLIPQSIKNFQEAFAYVDTLPSAPEKPAA